MGAWTCSLPDRQAKRPMWRIVFEVGYDGVRGRALLWFLLKLCRQEYYYLICSGGASMVSWVVFLGGTVGAARHMMCPMCAQTERRAHEHTHAVYSCASLIVLFEINSYYHESFIIFPPHHIIIIKFYISSSSLL